ncbi:uncharacterized protein [Chanodichthys erythropterus]|uniref:uncharacterized protein n=1 Tax=Chanodichthys erythropterus TaxID=933992 RepID=UPI00351E2667
MANAQPITKLDVSTCKDEEQKFSAQGYQFINVNLNQGAGGNQIFLWFKKECGNRPVTRIEFSLNAAMKPGLADAGYESRTIIYLWVKREKTSYIQEIAATVDFTSDKHMFELGYTRVCEDTNRNAGGNYVFIWYRRTTDKSKALTDLNISTSHEEESKLQNKGYKKISVDLNTGTKGKYVYPWYKKEPSQHSMVGPRWVSVHLG